MIIFAISAIIIIFKLFGRIVRLMTSEWDGRSDDYPGSKKFADFADMYRESNLDTKKFSDISDVDKENSLDSERRERVIFEEIISNIPFRYDEKTKILTIGERYNSSVEPVKVKLSSLDDLREFVDRLEEYVNE